MSIRIGAILGVVAVLVVPCSCSRLLRHSHHHRHRRHRASRHAPNLEQMDDNEYAARLFRQLVQSEDAPNSNRHRHHLSLTAFKGPDFPVAHESVREVLDGMDGSISKLKDKRNEQTADQAALLKSENEAVSHISDAVTMQHEIVRMQADLRVKDNKVNKLEEEEAGLQSEHDELHEHLKSVMDPRIAAKQEQLSQQESMQEKMEKDVAEWKAFHDQYRESANEKLKERKDNLVALHQAEDAVKAAEKARDEAADTYEQSRSDARKSVEQYKYVDTKYGGELAKDKDLTEEVRKDRDAVTSLQGIFKMEDQRIDESLFFARDRLQTRIKEAKASRVKTDEMLSELKKRYSSWQDQEEEFSAEAAKEKAAYSKSADAYASERKDVLHAAQEAAGARAVSDSDWADDDWAWSGGSNPDLSHLQEVPIAQ